MIRDNIIEWMFEKMFDQITNNGKILYTTPFSDINIKTFTNSIIHTVIKKLTGKDIDDIESYLNDISFRERFLFKKTKNKIDVQIMLGNLDKIKSLVSYGYQNNNLQLIILNNRLDILLYFLKLNPKIKLNNELLMYCSEYGYEDIYFFLRSKGLVPNISIYKKSILGGSLNIIRDISENIGLSNIILRSAFQMNNNDVILYLLKLATHEKIKIEKELVNYPLLNNNMQLLETLEKMGIIDWKPDLYYSALLSGSMDMIKYVESKIPGLHDDRILDTGSYKKGRATILLLDMIYEIDGKKYLAHTINYAIQSRSLDVVKYVHQRGYRITASNFVTAIKQGTPEILQYLCMNYHKELPNYLIYYFSIHSYIPDKIEKAKILFDSGYYTVYKEQHMTIKDYRKESVHLEMVEDITQIPEENTIDIDFLMNYRLLFTPEKGYKINHKLLTITRLFLELDMDEKLEMIFKIENKINNKQLLVDALYLFGKLSQIKKFHPYINDITPNDKVMMEIICYCQIGKIYYLIQNNYMTSNDLKKYYPLVTMISDSHLDIFFQKLVKFEQDIKYLSQSGNIDKISNFLSENQIIDIESIKTLLSLDDINLVKKIKIPTGMLEELIEWTEKNDLLEMCKHLKSLNG